MTMERYHGALPWSVAMERYHGGLPWSVTMECYQCIILEAPPGDQGPVTLLGSTGDKASFTGQTEGQLC